MSESDFISLDVKDLSQKDIYKLMIGGIIPRPIAVITSISSEGKLNLAPFSFFNGISSKPPCVMVSIHYRSNHDKKDTLRNIEETQEFVINSADENIVTKIVNAAAEYPYGVNEMSVVGLNPEPSIIVQPPRVKESSFQMECKPYKIVKIGDEPTGTHLVIGEILAFHVNKLVYQEGEINFENYHPAARLGSTGFAKLSDLYQIPIPKV